MKRVLVGVAMMAVLVVAHGQGVHVESDEPRAFGYQLGDTVQRHVTVHADAGWELDPASLPRPGARGGALELRRVAAAAHADGAGRRHELELQYQVFVSPTAVRTFEIPPIRLRFSRNEGPLPGSLTPAGGGPGLGTAQGAPITPQRSVDALVEAWPVTVAPLLPEDVSPRHGLGDLRPDHAPPLIDTHTMRLRLLVCAAAALLLLGALAVIQLGPPWRAAHNRPFGRAWRQLRRLPPDADGAQWRNACKTLHDALNRSAGEVLFEPGLERLIASQPAFNGLRDDLSRFLRLSRGEFFGDRVRAAGDAQWLVALCRRCRDAERGFTVQRER